MSTLLCFAYGSNLSWRRLEARVGAVTVETVAALPGHRLAFHKPGRDGSGKCDALATGDSRDRVWGAVYRIDDGQRQRLDHIEGDGYAATNRELVDASGRKLTAMTYRATRIEHGLQPLDWYLAHVLVGAHQHALPAEYLGSLSRVAYRADDDRGRWFRELAIYAGL